LEFKIESKENPNKDMYEKEDIDIAYSFSKKVVKEFGTFVKTIVIFGSVVRQEQNVNDIDILIVVDDVSIVLSDEIIESYRIVIQKIIAESSKKLHVTTLKMSNFWDYIRKGDPIGLNILRDGVALYDTGLFEPLRILLAQGRIAPSTETINVYLNKSMGSLFNSRNNILHATLNLYWAMIDMSHAALMSENILPVTPTHVSDKLEEVFVKSKKLESKYPKTMKKFYLLSKEIIHNKKTLITGSEYENLYKEAELYVERIKKLIKR
jgi:uncharacterized protein (UPF0332 family)/predicted nucleotidyltransferase